MTTTEQHIQHITRRNDTLAQKVDKLKAKGARVGKHTVHLLEVVTGAALGGVVQGMSKNPDGAHILKMPADLVVGIGLSAVGFIGVAGDWSDDVANFGTGFLAAYFSDKGYSVGKNKRETGAFFGHGSAPPPALPPGAPAAVHGAVSPQAMAEALLQQMQQR